MQVKMKAEPYCHSDEKPGEQDRKRAENPSLGLTAGTANLCVTGGGNVVCRGVKEYRGPAVDGFPGLVAGLVILISGTLSRAGDSATLLLLVEDWSNVEGRGVLKEREWLVYGRATRSPCDVVDVIVVVVVVVFIDVSGGEDDSATYRWYESMPFVVCFPTRRGTFALALASDAIDQRPAGE
ncbi:hypothetical protein CH063_03840 [Colletotrichum higginsianum]|uniref:Uncharacterized protein n=1 Tax=Colletotrichum higginsianum (strain IMI 349063) TaxID=759273 RepID=H1W1G1_COLHI|nr:hypothetical protein CH063_03840 [Colletotrichum higginsianum]